ncbi:cupin domain-containing protein [Brevundimonas lenta]|uniref:Quercetin dioxygenase-like cupin family protein n=1 Tax=Brevundimonas lenta TaxID=424796 RepID=A0A7W6NQ74_9CAUL|nr:cupin domain-containing protein [Brevundimonas lenta]MBB4084225.1 quercetin dioxygenase-like cupin family protein [Brevundimonas lenta]
MTPAALAFALALAAPPSDPAAITIRRASDGPASIGVGQVAYLSPDGEQAMGQIVLVEAPGYRTPVHVHHRTDESFYVLSGQLTLHVGGGALVLGPGDYVFIPRGTPHAQGNTGEEPTRLLLSVSSGDFIGFFHAREELVKTSPPGHPDYGPRMRALSDVYDVENLAAPPF